MANYLYLSCPETPDPPPAPTYYYYSGLLCGGSEEKYFRSTDPSLADHCTVIYGFCDTCGGGSNQCFDNISPSLVTNTNDVITCYADCLSCLGVTLNWVGISYSLSTPNSKFGPIGAPVTSLGIYTVDSLNVVTNVTASVTLSTGTYSLTISSGNDTSPILAVPANATFDSMSITSPTNPYIFDANTQYFFFAQY
jgi:hypothetical protein